MKSALPPKLAKALGAESKPEAPRPESITQASTRKSRGDVVGAVGGILHGASMSGTGCRPVRGENMESVHVVSVT